MKKLNYRTFGKTAPKKLLTDRSQFRPRKRRVDSFTKRQLSTLRKTTEPLSRLIKKSIVCANEVTNTLLKKYGVPEFNVTSATVFLIDNLIFSEFSDELCMAIAEPESNCIIINSDLTENIDLPATIFHEMSHIKAYIAHKYINGKGFSYRGGLEVHTNKGIYFKGINEALVCLMEKRYFKDYILGNDCLAVDYLSDREKFEKKYASIEQEENIMDGDIFYLEKDLSMYAFSMPEARKTLDYIFNCISNSLGILKNDVINEFEKAHFTGYLFPIARMIESTFGEKSFRLIGSIANTENSAKIYRSFLQSLYHQNKNPVSR